MFENVIAALERIEVPVDMLCEHDRSFLRGGGTDRGLQNTTVLNSVSHLNGEAHCIISLVSATGFRKYDTYVCFYETRETFVAAVKVEIRYTRLASFNYRPVTSVPTVNASVKRILTLKHTSVSTFNWLRVECLTIVVVRRNVIDAGTIGLRVLRNGDRKSSYTRIELIYDTGA